MSIINKISIALILTKYTQYAHKSTRQIMKHKTCSRAKGCQHYGDNQNIQAYGGKNGLHYAFYKKTKSKDIIGRSIPYRRIVKAKLWHNNVAQPT